MEFRFDVVGMYINGTKSVKHLIVVVENDDWLWMMKLEEE